MWLLMPDRNGPWWQILTDMPSPKIIALVAAPAAMLITALMMWRDRVNRTKKLPTDLQILEAIWTRYYDAYANYTKDAKNRETKILVPIDASRIAEDLGAERDIVFGRLYYVFERKYRYENKDGTIVTFFTRGLDEPGDHINFPYFATVLAEMRETERKHRNVTTIAVFALAISIASVLISFTATR